jgi:hypothetical protein
MATCYDVTERFESTIDQKGTKLRSYEKGTTLRTWYEDHQASPKHLFLVQIFSHFFFFFIIFQKKFPFIYLFILFLFYFLFFFLFLLISVWLFRFESTIDQKGTKLRSYEKGTKLWKRYDVTNMVRSYENGTKMLWNKLRNALFMKLPSYEIAFLIYGTFKPLSDVISKLGDVNRSSSLIVLELTVKNRPSGITQTLVFSTNFFSFFFLFHYFSKKNVE